MGQHGQSTWQGKQEIKQFLLSTLHPGAKILDVGAGGGTYYHLLGKDYDWRAVEIWHDSAIYLSQFYNIVYEGNITDFWYLEDYDLVIFGDILEHLTVEDAQECIARAKYYSKAIMIAFPYYTKQGPQYGNNAEIHIQDNCSPEQFDKLYPGFKRIVYIPKYEYAYYYWSKDDNLTNS